MNKHTRFLKNTAYTFIGTIGSKLIYILMLPLYTNWLLPDEFGAADTLTTYRDILLPLFFLCIADAAFVFPKNASELERKSYFTSGMVFILIMIIVSFLFLFIFVEILKSCNINNVFSNYSFIIWLMVITGYLQQYCQSFTMSIGKMFIYSMCGVILTALIAIFSVFLIPRYKLEGYAYAIIIAHFMTFLYCVIFSRSYNYFDIKQISLKRFKEMILYSIPLIPNSMMWWLVNGINRPMMEHYLGLSAIGIYAVSSRISGMINSLTGVLGISWSNSVLEEYGKDGFGRFFNQYLKIIVTFYFLAVFFLSIFSKQIVTLFTSVEYYDAWRYIPIISLGLVFSGMSGMYGAIFGAIKKSKYFFYSSFYGGIVSVVFLLFLTPCFGLYGVSFSIFASFLTILLMRIFYSKKYVLTNDWSYYIFLLSLYLLLLLNIMFVAAPYSYFISMSLLLLLIWMLRNDFKLVYMLIRKKF